MRVDSCLILEDVSVFPGRYVELPFVGRAYE